MVGTPEAAAEPIAPEVWRELLAALADEGEPRQLLTRLLELWCTEREATGAALYLDGDGAGERTATWGAGPFPESAEEAEAAFERLELAGAQILWQPGGAERPPSGGAGAELTFLLALAIANRRLRRRVERESFAARYRGVELEALYDVGLAITATLDIDVLTEEILLRAVSLLDARRGALYLAADGEHRLRARLGGDAVESFVLPPEAEPSVDLLPGAEHLLTVPIAVDGERRGVLAVADKESRFGVGPFTSADELTLGLFANQAAIALENARLHRDALAKERYERELQLAAEIQRQILPANVPVVDGYQVVGWNRPAREVGGDYYHLLALDREGEEHDGSARRLGVALGDVSGKGMPAALLVSTLHSAVRLLLGRVAVGPDLLARLNEHVLTSSSPNKFITLLLGELDAASGRFSYVNAGHNSGLLVRAGGEVVELPSGGLPVGLFSGSVYRPGSVDLAAGDVLCIFSDGITECLSPDDEEFGELRLVELLRQEAGRSAAEIAATIEQAVTTFADCDEQGDDQTVVVIKRV